MSGDPAILVDRYSAKSGRSWEDKPSHLHPINCSHSEMVKFPEHDEDCEVVLGKLKRFAELAPAVIRARWKDNTVVRPAPRAKLAFTKSTPTLASTIPSSNLQLHCSSAPHAKSAEMAISGVSMRSPPKEEPFDQVQVEQDETAQMTDPGNNGLDSTA